VRASQGNEYICAITYRAPIKDAAVRKPASAFRKVSDMEAIVKTSLSIYPTAKGVTLAVQPQGAAEIKVEFSPLEAMKQAHTLILHAMSHTRGPSGSTALPAVVAVGRIALKAVEMAETAVLDPARFVARGRDCHQPRGSTRHP
jgi:hypothetical protein